MCYDKGIERNIICRRKSKIGYIFMRAKHHKSVLISLHFPKILIKLIIGKERKERNILPTFKKICSIKNWLIFTKTVLNSKIICLSTSFKKPLKLRCFWSQVLLQTSSISNCWACNFFTLWIRMLISFLNDMDGYTTNFKIKYHPVCPKNP